jgi:hypothetical protein
MEAKPCSKIVDNLMRQGERKREEENESLCEHSSPSPSLFLPPATLEIMHLEGPPQASEGKGRYLGEEREQKGRKTQAYVVY